MAEIEGNNALVRVSQELAAINREQNALVGTLVERDESQGERAFAMDSLYDMMSSQTKFLENISRGVDTIISRIDEIMVQAGVDRQRMNELLREMGSGGGRGTPPPPSDDASEEKGFFDKIGEWLATFRKNFLLYLTAGLSALALSNFGFTGYFEKNVMGRIRDFVLNIFTRIKNFFVNIGNSLKNTLSQGTLDKITRIKEFFKPVTDIVKGIGGFLSRVGSLALKILRPLAIAMSLFDGFKSAKKAYDESGSLLKGLTMFIGGFVASFFGVFVDMIKDGVSKIFEWVGLDSISEFLDSFSIADMIEDGISVLYDVIAGNLKDLFTSPIDFIKRQFVIVGMMMTDLMNFVAEKLNLGYWVEMISQKIDGFLSPITGFFSSIGTFISEKIDGFLLPITGFFSSIGDSISEKFTSIKDWFGEKITSVFDIYKNAFSWIIEKVTGLFDPIINVFSEIGTKIGEFFNVDQLFTKVQKTLMNLFAEIGIPRVEMDVPLIGTVGFGPWYPFTPDNNGTTINSIDASNTVKTEMQETEEGYTQTKETTSRITDIQGVQNKELGGEYASDAGISLMAKSYDIETEKGADGLKETGTSTNVIGNFDYETGKAYVSFSKNIGQEMDDKWTELEDVYKRFEVGPITFGKVRRMIDAGATPEQVREFLEYNQKSVLEKISGFLGFGGSEDSKEKMSVADALNKDPSHTPQKLDTSSRQSKTEALMEQDTESSELKAQAAAPIVTVTNAPTSNVSNVSSQTALIENPSAEDGLSRKYGMI